MRQGGRCQWGNGLWRPVSRQDAAWSPDRIAEGGFGVDSRRQGDDIGFLCVDRAETAIRMQAAGRTNVLEPGGIGMNSTIETLKSHRSIRQYEDRPLPEGLLEELVACGQRASTSSNMQTYSVIHVAEPDRKAALAKLCGDQAQIHQSAAFLVFCADLNRCRLAGKLCGTDGLDGGYAEALLVATVDAALVMQNVAVAAESVGLGICMIGAIRNHPSAVGELLGLPALTFAVSGLCLGFPAQDPASKPRLPLGAALHRERYLDEGEHSAALEAYDRSMVAFYELQDMHPSDPRWTSVVAERAGAFHSRAELDTFLRDQGFLRHGGAPKNKEPNHR